MYISFIIFIFNFFFFFYAKEKKKKKKKTLASRMGEGIYETNGGFLF
jgi:preprotein translocase subunit YajC